MAALQQSRSLQSQSNYQEFLVKARGDGDANISVGGGLFPVSWSIDDVDYTKVNDFTSASLQTVSESFQETVRIASQQVDTERSIVISTYEEQDQINVTVRELQNNNDCIAVTYFVRRVYECYELSTRVTAVDWRLLGQERTSTSGFRSVHWYKYDDMNALDNNMRKQLHEALGYLPKVGDIVQDPRPVSVPTDGVLYEAELAHCSSCEPEKIAGAQVALEKTKAEERKLCLEADLLELEIKRRKLLLDKGDLSPFELISEQATQINPIS